MSHKQTKMVEDWKLFFARNLVFLKHFFEMKTSPKFRLFLSEHAYVVWLARDSSNLHSIQSIERFHSRDKPPDWFTQTKDDFCIIIEFNSQRTVLVHQYGRRFFVLEHQYGLRDVTWKRSIISTRVRLAVRTRLQTIPPTEVNNPPGEGGTWVKFYWVCAAGA